MSNSETNVFFIARRIRQAKASVEMRAKRATESVGLRMGIEFLTEGTMYVERADGTELLEIKRGAWPLEKVKAESERLFQLAQEAYVRSPLPPEPDRNRAEKLCVKMIAEYHGLSVG
jgi:hypothetical protein